MNISYAISKAGGARQLAEVLGVTRQVVNLWQRKGAMPELYTFKLRALKPKWQAQWRRDCLAAADELPGEGEQP